MNIQHNFAKKNAALTLIDLRRHITQAKAQNLEKYVYKCLEVEYKRIKDILRYKNHTTDMVGNKVFKSKHDVNNYFEKNKIAC